MNEKYKEYLSSPEWEQRKNKVFERALRNANSNNQFGVCEKCGYEPWKPCLQVHHKTYEHIYNEPLGDLILLCPRCHKAETEGNNVMKKDISFEIRKKLAALSISGTYRKEINVVVWNGKSESLDIRTWDYKDEGNPVPLKGVTLNAEETVQLVAAIKDFRIQETG